MPDPLDLDALEAAIERGMPGYFTAADARALIAENRLLRSWGKGFAEGVAKQLERAETAEARIQELEGALEQVKSWAEDPGIYAARSRFDRIIRIVDATQTPIEGEEK